MESGLVFNVQRYSVQDGPGIRTTVFLKGCPLRCKWCHNPEGISGGREVYVVESLCVGCGECTRACPRQPPPGEEAGRALPLPPQVEDCELCGACAEACPTQARRIVGQSMTVDEVLNAVLRDRVFYDESGGGVTFSGGEPLSQPGFLLALLKACRAERIHTAVDTCGLARTEDLLAIAPWTDLFLYDLKMMDSEAHERFTGAPNRLVIENLRRLGREHRQIWVRIPFVPGVNDAPHALEAAARFTASMPGVSQVNLLPFHRIGIQKSRRLGMSGPDYDSAPPSAESMAQAVLLFQQAGLNARAGG